MTRTGRQENEWVKNGKDGVKESVFIGGRVWNLKSQEEWVFASSPIVLNHYFDLTQPGVYHLTFHRIGFLVVQNDRKSLASNTLTFEILDEFVTPDDLRDPGKFNWPPPDVVSQPESGLESDVIPPTAKREMVFTHEHFDHSRWDENLFAFLGDEQLRLHKKKANGSARTIVTTGWPSLKNRCCWS